MINRFVVKEIIAEEFLYELAFRLQKRNIAASYYLRGLEQLKSLQSTRKQDKESFLVRQLRLLVPFFWSGTKARLVLSLDEKNKIEQIWRDFNDNVNHQNTATIKPGMIGHGHFHYQGL